MESQGDRQSSAFVVMPFSEEFAWVFDDLICPALQDAGYEIVRADSVVDQQNIMADIVQGVIGCDLIIAEITSLNPNVMYELGMAHALRRPTLILTQDVGSAPFDLRSYRLIGYSDNYREMSEVKTRLTDIALRHKNGEVTFRSPVTDFAPPEYWKNHLHQPPIMSAGDTETVVDPYEGQPGLFDREQEILEQLNVVREQAERLTEITNDFAQNLVARVEAVQELKGQPGPELSRRVRKAMTSTATLIVRWGADLEAELPPVREAWRQLEVAADELVTSASIESDEDRNAAWELVIVMEQFQVQLGDAVQNIVQAKESLLPLGRMSRDLDRAVHRAEQSLDSVVETLSAGEPFASRVANILRSRLEAYSVSPPQEGAS